MLKHPILRMQCSSAEGCKVGEAQGAVGGVSPQRRTPTETALSSSETGMSSDWLLVPLRGGKVSSSLNEELSSMLWCERFAPAGCSLEGFKGLDQDYPGSLAFAKVKVCHG